MRLSVSGKRHLAKQIVTKLRDADAMLAGGASSGQVCHKRAGVLESVRRNESREVRLVGLIPFLRRAKAWTSPPAYTCSKDHVVLTLVR